MNEDMSFAEAFTFAHKHALDGLQRLPFDVVYKTTMEQLAIIESTLFKGGGQLKDVPHTGVDLGLMAAKELGIDEQEFARALSVIQHDRDRAV